MAYFVDTNVLLYAVGFHPSETEKGRRAIDLLKEPELAISVQVLQEFYAQSTRRNRNPRLTHEEAMQFLATIRDIHVEQITLDVFHSAVSFCRRYQLSYWDGAILAAAESAGCDAVYSEDMSHEQVYGGIRVINPFSERR